MRNGSRCPVVLGCLVLFFAAGQVFAAPASKPRLAVFAFGNETGNTVYDSACAGAERSLVLTLRQLGLYELESLTRAIGRNDDELRAAAMERNADYVMFGGVSSGRGKELVFRLGLFDRAKGKTTVLRESESVTSLNLFEAIDDVISKVLDGITGGHLGFGAVELVNTGEKGTYRVLLDGMDAGDDLSELPRVLAGSHTLAVVQRRMLGEGEIARASFALKEGGFYEFKFAVPYLTAQEKERVEGAERAIRAEWQSPAARAQVAAKVEAFSALVRDVSYSPRLAEYQARSRQLEAEWEILKNRFEIEERAWHPDSLILDPSVVVYLTAKKYPDPETLKRGAESNASLLATLHELAAGAAMAQGRYDDGVKLLESILDFSRYMPSERKAEYAFAVATVKQLAGTRETNPQKFKTDLEAVFGAQMEAGTKMASLEEEAKRSGSAVIVSSDSEANLAVGDATVEIGPTLANAVGGEVTVRVLRGVEGSDVKVTVPAGRRVVFLDSGFRAFGRAQAEAGSSGPMAPLKIKCVPKGYTIFVNGEKVGITPLGQVMVKAGSLKVRFERQGEEPREMLAYAEPDREATVAWGGAYTFPIQLERRTIPLSADTDGWDGIDPILEGNFRHSYGALAKTDYAITRVYMCRDEKYLYWRLDFAEANPFVKTPKGIGKSMTAQLSMQYEGSKLLNYSLYKSYERATVESWKDIWNMASRQNTSLGRDAIVYRQGPTSLVQRVLLSGLDDYLKGTVPVFIQLANSTDGNNWGPGTLHTPMRYIDFSK